MTSSRTRNNELKQMLTLLGPHSRGTLVDSHDRPQLFIDPEAWIQVNEKARVADALSQLDELRRDRYLLGWFAYELGAILEPYLPQPATNGSLLEFASYAAPHIPPSGTPLFQPSDYRLSDLTFSTPREVYLKRIEEILEEIRVGSVYQVNFTVRQRFRFKGDPRALFLSLRRQQPVDHAQITRNRGTWVISVSPELFFRISNGQIFVRPMKGTIARGRTTAEDLLNEQRLLNSQKDRAENLMIVDLMRNDLGRIARLGSVQVDRLFEIEKLPTLFQMTSSLRACMADSVSLEQLLQALFPSGSVTGTPKLAAMKLIDELEDSPRGVYCGALGHFTPEETRFNVPIRTIVLRHEGARSADNPNGSYLGELGIGSGIVADSDPVSEWNETGLKASFLVRSRPEFSLVETIRFERGWVRLSAHLERLRDSAEYFGFPFDADRIEETLDSCGIRAENGAFKVRLLLGEKGDLRTEISEVSPDTAPPRLAAALEETDADDVFLYHKTTHRPLYHRARKAALKLGLWDLIFQNSQGEVTEGSICNIFIRLDGRWFTPPQRCGLLKGIMREEMLRDLKASEEPFRMAELYRADEILVSNSVQGALKAELVDGCYSVKGLPGKQLRQMTR